MTYYEQRLQNDKLELRQRVTTLASLVEEAIVNSVKALEYSDRHLAYETILKDGPINRLTETVESESHRFIAKHLPSAGHLRFVSAVMRIAVLLERMGDYAVTISRQVAVLSSPLEGAFKREVSTMAADALQMFRQAMQAFADSDESLARGTMGFAEQVDRDFVNALSLLKEAGSSGYTVEELFARLVIIRQLERVSDQAKNLCEETVFAITGQTKVRKPVRVLILDQTDDRNTQLAAAIARRGFADKLAVTTAGVRAGTLDPDVKVFLEQHGYPVDGLHCRSLEPSSLDEPFKVIISLRGAVTDYIPSIPFSSVALEWDLTEGGGDVEAAYRVLTARLSDLATLVRG